MLGNLLVAAIREHKAGNLEDAKRLYIEILATDMHHAKSLYGLGLIAHQTGNLEIAAKMISRAIAAEGKVAAYHSSLGTILRIQKKHEEALAAYRHAASLKPNDDEAHFNVGEVLREMGKLEEARAHFKHALALRPDRPETLNSLAQVLQLEGKLGEAKTQYEQALALKPDFAEAHTNLGNIFLQQGMLGEAKAQYERALALKPDLPEAHSNLGSVLLEQGHPEEAAACHERALALRPDYAEARSNRGNVSRVQGKLLQAKTHYEQALAMNPNLASAHSNLGNVLLALNEPAKARAHVDRALLLNPDLVDAQWSRCLLNLLEGNFAAGWRDYEVRHRRMKTKPRSFSAPLWSGEPLQGATILLHSEQGLGDSIQFLRYVAMVQAAGGAVILDLPPRLHRIAAQLSPGVQLLTSPEDPLPAIDWHCPLMSLPRAFGTTLDTIPGRVPYLTIPNDALKTADSFPWPAEGYRVGIVWRGSPHNQEDRFRSIPAPLLEPLLNLEGVRFYSLQIGAAAEDLSLVKAPVEDLQGLQVDLADTAALLTHLDLVISVDTAVAHLAGALACPTWLLVSLAPDWRWLLDREDSPWYPTMRLFRQSMHNDWPSVIDRVRSELAALIRTP